MHIVLALLYLSGAFLSVSPEQAPVGATLTFTGHGFAPGELVHLTLIELDNTQVEIPAKYADAGGKLNFTLVATEQEAGRVTLQAHGQSSDLKTQAQFTILVPHRTSPPVADIPRDPLLAGLEVHGGEPVVAPGTGLGLGRWGWYGLVAALAALLFLRRRPRAVLALVLLMGPPVQAQEANLLRNGDFEETFEQFGHYATAQVAPEWTPWWLPQPAGSPPWQNRMPEFKPAAPYSYRCHTGRNAQQLFTLFGTHIGGVWQRVEGVTPGSTLRFTAWGHAWAGKNDDPYTSTGGGPMHMRIGIDPTGGTDPYSTHIVWSEEQNPLDTWLHFAVEVEAAGPVVTVYTRSAPTYPTKHNDVYWDDTALGVIAIPTPVPVRRVSATATPIRSEPPRDPLLAGLEAHGGEPVVAPDTGFGLGNWGWYGFWALLAALPLMRRKK